jgi:deoxyadenosine/deoxycytidine kinase
MNIYIEGNIGSGKSTFLNILKNRLTDEKQGKYSERISNGSYSFITEPVDEWLATTDNSGKNILEYFYEDQNRWSFAFQMNSFISRVHRIQNEKKSINFIERSVFTDRYCFARNCFTSGKISEIEYKIYCKWNDWLVENFDIKPTAYIYLRTSPEVCSERINGRNRNGEESIPLDYLQQLHDHHDDWLLRIEKNNNVHVLEIDVTNNYLDNEKDIETFIGHIENFINLVNNYKINNPTVTLN